MPYVVDDRALRNIDKSDNVQYKDLLLSIFREYDSRVKERAGGKNAQFAGMRIYGPMLNSSVVSIFEQINKLKDITDLGQYRRLIEIQYTKENSYNIPGIDKMELLSDIQIATEKCYGHIFIEFIKYLINVNNILSESGAFKSTSLEDDVHRRYEQNKEIVEEIIEEFDKIDKKKNDYLSSKNRFALLLTSYDYLYRFIYEYDNTACEYDKKDMAAFLVNNLRAKITDRDGAFRKSSGSKGKNDNKKIKDIPANEVYNKIKKFFDKYKDAHELINGKQVDYMGKLGGYKFINNNKTLELRYRPEMGIEFMIFYADEFLETSMSIEEVYEYVERCNTKSGSLVPEEIEAYMKEKFGISKKVYDNYRDKAADTLNNIGTQDNRIEVDPEAEKIAKGGKKTLLVKIDLPQEDTTEIGEA